MGFVKIEIFFCSLMAVFGFCLGSVYNVGDSAGWTIIGNVDYNTWASSKTFQIGDTLSKLIIFFTNLTILIVKYSCLVNMYGKILMLLTYTKMIQFRMYFSCLFVQMVSSTVLSFN